MDLMIGNTTLNEFQQTHFIRHFLNMRANKSQHTAIAYERDILDFFKVTEIETIQIQDIVQINFIHAEQYILELRKKGCAASTINRKISSLSSLYNWLMKYQDNLTGKTLLYFNPFSNLKEEKPTVTVKETEFLTAEECEILLNSFDTTKLLDLRNKTILSLAFTTALRKSEIINIKLQDIKKYGDYETIEVLRKGNKLDRIKIQPSVKKLIDDYVYQTGRNYTTDSYLFLGHSRNKLNNEKLDPSALNYMIKSVCKRAGINKNLKVHSTRHTAITLAIIGGATIEKVRDFAAHNSIVTTNRYVHSIDKLKDNAGDVIQFDALS